MKKPWFSAKELASIAGLPSTPQGVTLKAKRESWKRRRRTGVQGKAFEYQVDSLPIPLHLNEPLAKYTVTREDLLAILVKACHQLTEDECERLLRFICREGIGKLIHLLEHSKE